MLGADVVVVLSDGLVLRQSEDAFAGWVEAIERPSRASGRGRGYGRRRSDVACVGDVSPRAAGHPRLDGAHNERGNSTSGESGYQRDTDDFGRHDGGPSTISRMRAAVAPKEAST